MNEKSTPKVMSGCNHHLSVRRVRSLIFAGAGNIVSTGANSITLEAGGTGVSSIIQIGTASGKSTPDILVLDAGSSDPAGTNGGMYYSTATNKFRCYENGSWRNCLGSAPQQVIINMPSITVASTATLLGTFSITPTTASGETLRASARQN